jgi:RHS repeat-associated protein
MNLDDPTQPSFLTLPPVFLVIKGDTAYEYSYQQTVYQRASDRSMAPFPLGDLPSAIAAAGDENFALMQPNVKAFRDYPDMYYDANGRLNAWNAFKAQYRLNRILNRHQEWIEFTYPTAGGWVATWMVGGTSTGVSITVTPTSPTQSYLDITYAGLGAPYDYQVVPGPLKPPVEANQFLQFCDAQGKVTSQESGSDQMPIMENTQRLSPGTVTNVSTGEVATFTYGFATGPITGNGAAWNFPGYSGSTGNRVAFAPLVLTSVALPGKTISFEWTSYGYRRNALDSQSAFGGYVQSTNVGYTGGGESWISVPRYASFSGVTKVTETDTATGIQKVTTHTRVVPIPDWNTSTGWLNTQFYDAITRPDGSTVVYLFVPPLSNRKTGGPSDSTADEQMQTLAHLKHQVADIREYTPGASWQTDLGLPPGSGTAFRTTVYDRWDLRSTGNPTGDINVSSTPYPTRTRVLSRELPNMTENESLDWDAQNLGWRLHRKTWRGAALSTSDFRSVAGQGLPVPARPGVVQGALPAVRDEVRTLSRNLGEWTFDRTDAKNVNHSDATMGLAPGAQASLDLPPQATNWDTAVPFSRISSQQIGGGTIQLTTQFGYENSTGPAALHLHAATLTGTGVVLPANPVGVSAYGYDSYGYISTVTPWLPAGRNWTLSQTNTGQGLPQNQTDANGLVISFEWGPGGRMSDILPPNGETATRFDYDTDNLGVNIWRGSRMTHLRYNGFGQLIREARENADGRWNHRLTGYDLMGRKTWETGWRPLEGVDNLWAAVLAPEDQYSPAQDAWTEVKPVYEYYPGGQKVIVDYITINHPAVPARFVNPNSTHYTYDGQGRLILIQKPTGESVSILPAVGGNGLISWQTVAPGTAQQAITILNRDELGRLVTVTDALGQVTNYRYDAADRISQVVQTDPKTSATQVRTWEYDTFGRMTALVQPESGRTEYSEFTAQSNPTRTIFGAGSGSPRGLTTSYDELGRVTAVVSDDGTVNQVFTYDEGGSDALANGKLTSAGANGVVRVLGYAGPGGLNGRLTTLTRRVDGLTPFAQSLTYTSDGLLASRVYPDGRRQSLGYDAAEGLPTSSSFGGPSLATLGYDPTTWNPAQISYANGATSSFVYDADQTRLKSMTHGIPGATDFPRTWTFRYDESGRLSSDGEDWYSYDRLNRLVSAFVRDPFNSNGSQGLLQQFDYDAFGNRTTLKSWTVANWTAGAAPPTAPGTLTTAKAQSYAMNTSEIAAMAATDHLPGTLGGVATGSSYDAQGNLTQIYGTLGKALTQLTLGYDALGRVASLGDSQNATSQAYGYDDEGLRMKAVDSKTGVTTYNIYNEARQLIATYTKTGTGPLTWKKDIVYVGIKELAEVDATKTWVTFTDHLGSPRLIWNGTAPVGGKPDGVNLIQQKFLPFGESLAGPIDAGKFAKGFTNHEQTDPSGLIYMQARFYLPMYGRFASPDPARDQHFEETQSWNIYSYCQNQPTMMTDPTGMVMGLPGLGEIYDKALDVAAAGLTYGKMVPGLGAGIMLGEAASGQRVDTSGNVQQLSKDQRIDTGLAGGASLALQLVAAGSPATSTLSVPGGAVNQGGALALQTATVTVPSATAVVGAAAVPAAAAMTGGPGSGGGEKAKDRRAREQEKAQEGKSENQTPGNNRAQNRQFKDVVKRTGLDKDKARQLHQQNSKQGMSRKELLEEAKRFK